MGDRTKELIHRTHIYIPYVTLAGIGFKSVYMAADAVFIASGPYCFAFDATKPLGMVTPHWLERSQFPAPLADSDGTIIHLRFKPSFKVAKLTTAMSSLDPFTILCLNKLRCVVC